MMLKRLAFNKLAAFERMKTFLVFAFKLCKYLFFQDGGLAGKEHVDLPFMKLDIPYFLLLLGSLQVV